MIPPITSSDAEPPHATVEPLFAHNTTLWLRVWLAIQAAGIGVATYVIVDGAGGVAPMLRSPDAAPAIAALFLLVVYHVVGVRAHAWILGRRWAVLLFVPVGWAVVLYAIGVHGAFAPLLMGAIVQGFIFLPFAWAVTILALVTAGTAGLIITVGEPAGGTATVLKRTGGVIAAGVMIGTVLLYIHRVNREAVLRARLLRQLHDAQRDLAEHAREAGVQDERQRFARDIHDTLAQGFTSVIKHLEAIELSLDASATENNGARDRVRQHLAHAQTVSRSSVDEIRRLVWALRPTPLDGSTLSEALARVVGQWSGANAVPATFDSDALPALQPDADVIFLRATQEALSNVARHAGATTVGVSLRSVDGLALLTVEDDGRGFAHTDAPGVEGLGLSGMRERVRRFGGHLMIESTPGRGTSLSVAIPLVSIAAARDAGRAEA
jgi:signal transduction histidine kinase